MYYSECVQIFFVYNIVIRRAPINCIRCHRMRQKGRFKCGRCGDLYTLSPLLDPSGKLTKQQDHIHTDDTEC